MKPFYWYLRPLAFLGKCLGVFPIHNILSSDPKNLSHSFFSFNQLYSFLMFGFNLAMIKFFSGFIFFVGQSMFLHFVVYLILARSVMCLFFCCVKSKKSPKLIQLLHIYDQRKLKTLTKYNKSHFKLFINWTLLPLIILFSTLTFSYFNSAKLIKLIFSPTFANSEDGIIAATFFGLLSTWQVVPLLLYIYFASKILLSLKEINNTLIENNFTGSYTSQESAFPEHIAKFLGEIRILHNILSEAVAEMGRNYGDFLALDHFSVIIMFIVNIGAYIYDHTQTPSLILITLFNGITVLTVILISDEIKNAVSINQFSYLKLPKGCFIIELFHGVPINLLNKPVTDEIQMIMMQISLRPLQVSAAGYFIVDKSQIVEIISQVATYLIVVIQFLQDCRK